MNDKQTRFGLPDDPPELWKGDDAIVFVRLTAAQARWLASRLWDAAHRTNLDPLERSRSLDVRDRIGDALAWLTGSEASG